MDLDTTPVDLDGEDIEIDLERPDDSYIVDLTVSRPIARPLTDARLERAIVNSSDALSFNDLIGDYDTPVFETKKAADEFLKKYLKELDGMKNSKTCLSRDLPAMLLKRRYMIFTLWGVKTWTERPRLKKLEPGQLFNFHDQVRFVTVRLKSIKETPNGDFRYNFELP